jgi:hypothetical protein
MYGLPNYTKAMKRSPMDSGDNDAQNFPLPAYRCVLQPFLLFVKHPSLSKAITTSTCVNRMARQRESGPTKNYGNHIYIYIYIDINLIWQQILKGKDWSMRLGWITPCVAKKMFESKPKGGRKLCRSILRWLDDAYND